MDINFIHQEFKDLLKDLEFINKLPHTLNLGFFLVETSEAKQKLKESIENCLSEFKKGISEKANQLLLKNETIFNDLTRKVLVAPNTLEEFIECKKYISSEEFKGSKKSMTADLAQIKLLLNLADVYLIPFDENTVVIYIESSTWIIKLKTVKRKVANQLEEMRLKFKRITEERNSKIISEFSTIKTEIDNFENYTDLKNAFNIANSAKNVESGLKNLVERSMLLNQQEEFLGYPHSPLEHIKYSLNGFEKYFDLWCFAEKWRFVFI